MEIIMIYGRIYLRVSIMKSLSTAVLILL